MKNPSYGPTFQNLGPISILPFISKLTERAVADQTKGHMTVNKLYPLLQSAYRKNHNTETALLKVKNDLLLAMNKEHVTLLVLLNLSAAFGTVDHDILMRRLGTKLGLMETVLSWFSYLTGRHQKVVNGTFSDIFELKCGVSRGSCLSPLLFTIYSSKLFDIIESHLPYLHVFSDDTQLYIAFNPNGSADKEEAIATIELCIKDLRSWITRDKLMFNDGKTEIAYLSTPQQLQKVSCDKITIGDAEIYPVTAVKDLGVWLNSALTISMIAHVNKSFSSAFLDLYNIRHIMKFLSRQHNETLIHAFATGRLDYCNNPGNNLLYGLPGKTLCKLHRIQDLIRLPLAKTTKFQTSIKYNIAKSWISLSIVLN